MLLQSWKTHIIWVIFPVVHNFTLYVNFYIEKYIKHDWNSNSSIGRVIDLISVCLQKSYFYSNLKICAPFTNLFSIKSVTWNVLLMGIKLSLVIWIILSPISYNSIPFLSSSLICNYNQFYKKGQTSTPCHLVVCFLRLIDNFEFWSYIIIYKILVFLHLKF